MEAAYYVGTGPTLFDEMVADGRMPKPRRFNNRVIWDRLELDAAFAEAPYREANQIDEIRARAEARRRLAEGGQ